MIKPWTPEGTGGILTDTKFGLISQKKEIKADFSSRTDWHFVGLWIWDWMRTFIFLLVFLPLPSKWGRDSVTFVPLWCLPGGPSGLHGCVPRNYFSQGNFQNIHPSCCTKVIQPFILSRMFSMDMLLARVQSGHWNTNTKDQSCCQGACNLAGSREACDWESPQMG